MPEQLDFDPENTEFERYIDIWDSAVASHGDRVAFSLVLQSGDILEKTYKEMDRHITEMAAYLRHTQGLNEGDVLAIQLPNSIHYPIALLGAMRAGLTVTSINPMYSAREIVHQLNDSGAKTLIGFNMFAGQIEKVQKQVALSQIILAAPWEFFPFVTSNKIKFFLSNVQKAVPAINFAYEPFEGALKKGRKTKKTEFPILSINSDSPAILQYTGGTTGVSKGAVLTHKNLTSCVSMTLTLSDRVLVTEEQVNILTVLPLYHIFAFMLNLSISLCIGARNILIPNPRPLSNLKPAFDAYSVDWLTGVETLYAGLLTEKWFTKNPPAIKLSIAGGTALRPETERKWEALVGQICEGYGLTETACVVSFNIPDHTKKLGTVGIPTAGISIRIEDDDGNPVESGTPGHLLVKGANVTKEYLNRPEEAEKTFKGGWLSTGDIAVMDGNGYLSIVDREKDMILVSGFNVFPNEIENIITEIEGVAEVAVIGIPHVKRGEAPKAFVVANSGSLSQAQILNYCKEHLTAYKVPVEVEFMEDLPKTIVGKVLRKELRNLKPAE